MFAFIPEAGKRGLVVRFLFEAVIKVTAVAFGECRVGEIPTSGGEMGTDVRRAQTVCACFSR
jgi:hypothetical protein